MKSGTRSASRGEYRTVVRFAATFLSPVLWYVLGQSASALPSLTFGVPLAMRFFPRDENHVIFFSTPPGFGRCGFIHEPGLFSDFSRRANGPGRVRWRQRRNDGRCGDGWRRSRGGCGGGSRQRTRGHGHGSRWRRAAGQPGNATRRRRRDALRGPDDEFCQPVLRAGHQLQRWHRSGPSWVRQRAAGYESADGGNEHPTPQFAVLSAQHRVVRTQLALCPGWLHDAKRIDHPALSG